MIGFSGLGFCVNSHSHNRETPRKWPNERKAGRPEGTARPFEENWLTVRQSFGSPVPNFSVRMRADRTPAVLRASAAAFMKPAGPQRR